MREKFLGLSVIEAGKVLPGIGIGEHVGCVRISDERRKGGVWPGVWQEQEGWAGTFF